MLLHGFIIQKPWGTMDLLSFQVKSWGDCTTPVMVV
jgi:hypothetical protein